MSKKYRIVENTKVNGKKYFLVEYESKCIFGSDWYNIIDSRSCESNMFKTIEEANKKLLEHKGEKIESVKYYYD